MCQVGIPKVNLGFAFGFSLTQGEGVLTSDEYVSRLNNRGLSPFGGDSDHFGGQHQGY